MYFKWCRLGHASSSSWHDRTPVPSAQTPSPKHPNQGERKAPSNVNQACFAFLCYPTKNNKPKAFLCYSMLTLPLSYGLPVTPEDRYHGLAGTDVSLHRRCGLEVARLDRFGLGRGRFGFVGTREMGRNGRQDSRNENRTWFLALSVLKRFQSQFDDMSCRWIRWLMRGEAGYKQEVFLFCAVCGCIL